MPQPIAYRWTGEVMLPLPRFTQACASQFVAGQVYRLKPDLERSPESHGHYFVCVHAAFDNLPEAFSDRFASVDHLRKWCLIKAGYRDDRTFVAPSPADARRLAAFVAPLDEFAVVIVEGNLVSVLTAKSQKLRRSGDDGMGKDEFEASKEAVLRECSRIIGVDVVTLLDAPSVAPFHVRDHVTEPTTEIKTPQASISLNAQQSRRADKSVRVPAT